MAGLSAQREASAAALAVVLIIKTHFTRSYTIIIILCSWNHARYVTVGGHRNGLAVGAGIDELQRHPSRRTSGDASLRVRDVVRRCVQHVGRRSCRGLRAGAHQHGPAPATQPHAGIPRPVGLWGEDSGPYKLTWSELDRA